MGGDGFTNDLLETTFYEAQKHWTAFKSYCKERNTLSLLASDNSQLCQKQLTEGVSQPVQSYFQQHAPHYLSYLRATHQPDDGWYRWAQKGVWNASLDVVSRYAHLALSPLATFLHDTAKKVPEETFIRLSPANLLVLSTHSPLVRQYFAQRVDQLTTPIQYLQDFRGTLEKQLFATRGALTNATEHARKLEGGFTDRTKQLGHIVIDMAEQTIAGKIGVALAVFAVYRVPSSVRARTQASFDALFPRGSLRGMVGRQLPVRFLFSKPIARVAGNPVLSFAVVSYLISMSIARTISDSLELKRKHPDIHKRLASYDRDVVNAPLHLKYRDTYEKLSKGW